MTTARGGHRATLLGNGKVVLTGGIDASGTPLATAELYDPMAGKFSAAATMNAARYNHVAVILNDGTVLVVGGTGSSFALSSAEVYDPVMNLFQPVGSMSNPRTQAAGVLLK
jgi:large repetitive protein